MGCKRVCWCFGASHVQASSHRRQALRSSSACVHVWAASKRLACLTVNRCISLQGLRACAFCCMRAGLQQVAHQVQCAVLISVYIHIYIYSAGTNVQETIPQHDYRLEAAALSARRFGEVSCRDYREAVLRAMPHSWTRLADTRVRAAHFARHREARGAAKLQLADGSAAAARGGGGRRARRRRGAAAAVVSKAFGGDGANGATGADVSGAGGAKGAQHKKANVLVAHSEQGLDVVNLYSGAELPEHRGVGYLVPAATSVRLISSCLHFEWKHTLQFSFAAHATALVTPHSSACQITHVMCTIDILRHAYTSVVQASRFANSGLRHTAFTLTSTATASWTMRSPSRTLHTRTPATTRTTRCAPATRTCTLATRPTHRFSTARSAARAARTRPRYSMQSMR